MPGALTAASGTAGDGTSMSPPAKSMHAMQDLPARGAVGAVSRLSRGIFASIEAFMPSVAMSTVIAPNRWG